jgi:Flp pilus assembly protein TadG
MRTRRGNYAMLLLVALLALLGFGALAIDTGYMMLARAQAQDIADAASQAALIVLRSSGDTIDARNAALQVVAANEIVGREPDLISLEFGAWDDTEAIPEFVPGVVTPNAVRVAVGRQGPNAISFLLARLWGYTTFETRASSTSATRSTQVVIVLDITGSWGEEDFLNARAAVLTALDMLAETVSGVDEVAMTIFTNRYAWEYTPLTNIARPENAAAVREDWLLLNIASKAGVDADPDDGAACVLHGGARANDFLSPAGGCYPPMPREYTDEPGTDHSTGVLLAKQLFEESRNGASYRAMIVLTDGRPNDLGAASGTVRATQGYVETRWREYLGPVPRSKDAIRGATIAATDDLYDDLAVNTWVVSLVEHDAMMPAMVRGDGYYVRTQDSGLLGAILAQIISEMPTAIVE